MKILVTGGFGIVGREVVRNLVQRGEEVRVFDRPSRRAARAVRSLLGRCSDPRVEISFGNLLNIADVTEAVRGVDAVIHLAAVIPPLADRRPQLAEQVNVLGTENLVRALEKLPDSPRLIYTSSIAVYGDRVENPFIRVDDPPRPNEDDFYAQQKLRCEKIVRASSLKWTIPRLTYIVSPDKLAMDPIMFEMPLKTSLEICRAEDAASALVDVLFTDALNGSVWHLAGGETCRMSYRTYLNRMMEAFGLGCWTPPEESFSTRGFHCGFMDTASSEGLLGYQIHIGEDYFREVYRRYRVGRFFIRLVRPAVRWYVLARSPYYWRYLKGFGRRWGYRSRCVLRALFGGGPPLTA